MTLTRKIEYLSGDIKEFVKQHTPHNKHIDSLLDKIKHDDLEKTIRKYSPENIYNKVYDKLRENKGKNSKFSEYISKIGNYGQGVTGALAAASLVSIPYTMYIGTASPENSIFYIGTTAAFGALALHSNSIKKIFEKTHDKNTGTKLSKEEIQEVTKAGKISKYTNFATTGIIAASATVNSVIDPILSVIVLAPLAVYGGVIYGRYTKVIEAAVDYTTGKARKNFPKLIPVRRTQYPQKKRKYQKKKKLKREYLKK